MVKRRPATSTYRMKMRLAAVWLVVASSVVAGLVIANLPDEGLRPHEWQARLEALAEDAIRRAKARPGPTQRVVITLAPPPPVCPPLPACQLLAGAENLLARPTTEAVAEPPRPLLADAENLLARPTTEAVAAALPPTPPEPRPEVAAEAVPPELVTAADDVDHPAPAEAPPPPPPVPAPAGIDYRVTIGDFPPQPALPAAIASDTAPIILRDPSKVAAAMPTPPVRRPVPQRRRVRSIFGSHDSAPFRQAVAAPHDVPGWNGVEWGAAADRLIQAFGAQVSERGDEDTEYEEGFVVTHLIDGVRFGSLAFKVVFQMSPDTRELAQVLVDGMAPPKRGEFEALYNHMVEIYGTPSYYVDYMKNGNPTSASKNMYKKAAWRFPSTTIHLTVMAGPAYFSERPGWLYLRYFPTPKGTG